MYKEILVYSYNGIYTAMKMKKSTATHNMNKFYKYSVEQNKSDVY